MFSDLLAQLTALLSDRVGGSLIFIGEDNANKLLFSRWILLQNRIFLGRFYHRIHKMEGGFETKMYTPNFITLSSKRFLVRGKLFGSMQYRLQESGFVALINVTLVMEE